MTFLDTISGAARSMGRLSRSESDPRIVQAGPTALPRADRVARALGWFSLALGLTELLAPRAITRPLGVAGREGMVRGAGLREIGSGLLALSVDRRAGLWSRVAGDGIDIASALVALRRQRGWRRSSQRRNLKLTLAVLGGVLLIDLLAAKAVSARHARDRAASPPHGRDRVAGPDGRRDFSDRSGFPHGVESARGQSARRASLPDSRGQDPAPRRRSRQDATASAAD
jgi:hypothetical protein